MSVDDGSVWSKFTAIGIRLSNTFTFIHTSYIMYIHVMYTCTYIHDIHDIHTFIHTYMYIHTYIHTYMYVYMTYIIYIYTFIIINYV